MQAKADPSSSQNHPAKAAEPESALVVPAATHFRKGPVHGVDYINDYYAILKISPHATLQEVHAGYREQARAWHSDRQARGPEEFKIESDRRSKLINEAHDVLENDVRREAYDKLLATFPAELRSDDGVPIRVYGGGQRTVELDYLVSGLRLSGSEDHELRIAQHVGHSEDLLSMVAAQFAAKPSPQLSAMYQELLERKLTHLTLMEESAWASAGVTNQPEPKRAMSPEDFVVARFAQIEETKQELPKLIDLRLKALAGGAAPLLLPGEVTPITFVEDPAAGLAVRENLVARASSAFESHEAKLKEIAQQRAEVIQSLLDLRELEYLADSPRDGQTLAIVVVKKAPKPTVLVYARQEDDSIVGSCAKRDLLATSTGELSTPMIASLISDEGVTNLSVITLELSSELSPHMQLMHAAKCHFQAAEESH